MALTFLVEGPWTYICIMASTSAFSLRWYLSKSSVQKAPSRDWGTRSSSLPTRVTRALV